MRKTGLLLGLLLVLFACKNTPLDEARELVAIGDLRDDAILSLQTEAWYHQSCPNQSSIDDLFFYGSQQYEKTDIVIMTSVLEDNEYRVSKISSFEAYAWQAAYRDCIDRSKFSD